MVALLLAGGACADDAPSLTTLGGSETDGDTTTDSPTTGITTIEPDSSGGSVGMDSGDTTEGMTTEGMTELVVSGDRPDLVDVALRAFRPTTVLAWGEPGPGPLWEGRVDDGSDGRAYLCRDHLCEAPITDASELVRALDAHRRRA